MYGKSIYLQSVRLGNSVIDLWHYVGLRNDIITASKSLLGVENL